MGGWVDGWIGGWVDRWSGGVMEWWSDGVVEDGMAVLLLLLFVLLLDS